MTITVDKVLANELKSRGIDSSTGVYGDHKLQIGNGEPIALDKIPSNSVPGEGWSQATKIARGTAGLKTMAEDTLKALTNPSGKFDAKSLLGALMAGKTQIGRMASLGQLTPEQRENTMWIFTRAIEKLSNTDLATIYQTFTSKEMDLLQSALQREMHINKDAADAGFAADALFDLNALIVKEVSNRAMLSQIDDALEHAEEQQERQGLELMKPQKLSETYGSIPAGPEGQPAPAPQPAGPDMTAMNLMTLVEVSAGSATQREKTAGSEAQRLARRGVDGVTVTDMANVMRKSELTINMSVDVLFKDTSILKKPDQPLLNIFQLKKMGLSTKSDEYIKLRDTAEKQVFPAYEGHDIKPEERPVYGALNLKQHSKGAVADGEYGNVCIVLKDSVKKRTTFSGGDTFYAPKIKITPERKENFYKLLDGCGISPEAARILRDPNSEAHKKLEKKLDVLAHSRMADATAFKTGAKATGLSLSDPEDACLRNLLFQCFVDSEQTQSGLATYESLESLVTGLDDIDGNMLATASRNASQGKNSTAVLGSGKYIEGQIHGPVVPSRDIAEIRIDISDLESQYPDPADLENAKAELRAFTIRTGIPVTITNVEDTENEKVSQVEEQNLVFSDSHMDKEKAEQLQQKLLEDFDSFVKFADTGDSLTVPADNLHITEDEKGRIWDLAHQKLDAEFEQHGISADAQHVADTTAKQALEEVLRPRTEKIVNDARTIRENLIAGLGNAVTEFTGRHPELTHGYDFKLEGAAAAELAKQFRKMVMQNLKTTLRPDEDLPGLVQRAFESTLTEMIAQKLPLMEKLDALGIENPKAKALFTSLINSDASGLTPDTLEALSQAAHANFAMLQGMLNANPPKTAGEITQALQQTVLALTQSAGNPARVRELARKSLDLAVSMLALSEPAVGIEDMRKLRDAVDGTQMRQTLSMTKRAALLAENPADAAPVNLFVEMAEGLGSALCGKVREMDIAGQDAKINDLPPEEQEQARLVLSTNERPYSAPEVFIGTPGMISAQVRDQISVLSPALRQSLDARFPVIAAFPAPAQPQQLPQTDADRKQFLLNHIDLYLRHEKTFEKGKSTHGRGHIARAFIFANVMSNILIEKGVKVDKNAVMLGITGHDVGRLGSNRDQWEERSANMTVDLMKQDYGADSMGEAYSTEVGKCINAHQSQTVEGMLLNSADSLDIGRTKDFDPQYFGFLKDANIPGAEELRRELMKEADLLQRLTDYQCMNKNLIFKYAQEAGDENNPESVQEEMSNQLSQLAQDIGQQFIDDWDVPAGEFFSKIENVVKNNPDLFPVMNKYYTA